MDERCQVDPKTRDMLHRVMDTLDRLQSMSLGTTTQIDTVLTAREVLREIWLRIHYWTSECPPSTTSNAGSENPPSNES